ncbi:family 43 glycosylhydrolase [Paraflavitalea pollutisoli]|uniref:family 43 glycosylhydrolase n=1 Tax=Paraflavitalea pollutisoli TaxID=3034143 RepID=UPI0023EBCD80|nr:family 43 glycosylhydrolase [Paraflavitalea sp. H1-2-19X]
MTKAIIHITAILVASFMSLATVAQPAKSPAMTTYANAVIPGDFADPSVIKVGDTYYATGTSSEWAPHFPLFTSKDLVNWKQVGYVFNKTPEWASASFWAPELYYHNNTFYVYYVARRKSDNQSFIAVATTKDPLKGFTDHGIIIEHGKEAIDAYILNDKGTLYMTFKAYGLDKRPIEILGCKLTPDGLKRDGDYFTLLRDDDRKGMEGQVHLKWNNHYYLFYSAGGCCGVGCSYNVRVARAEKIEGPYTNFEGNPILTQNDTWKCPGHGTFVQTAPDTWYYLYHAFSQKDNVFTGRQGMLDVLKWKEYTGWPFFNQGNSPSVTNALPAAAKAQTIGRDVRDEFKGSKLPLYWQWDFRHTVPATTIKKGSLYLSGKPTADNVTGTALTVRPVSGNYEMTTQVINKNAALKGLTLYGDANQAVGIGIAGDTVQVWETKDNKRTILAQANVLQATIQLRMKVENGYQVRFYYSLKPGDWQELSASNQSYYDGRHLPPWDRSPRPGLLQRGNATEPAVFADFSLVYQD